MKAIYDKPIANIIFNGERWKALLFRNKTKMLTLTTRIQGSAGDPKGAIRQKIK